jgi:divalent metal cation (Fe/Co/Zn/Cd) transporter
MARDRLPAILMSTANSSTIVGINSSPPATPIRAATIPMPTPARTPTEEGAAEKRALYLVAITFFLLAIYITWEAVNSLLTREEPLTSPVGIGLAVLSLVVMPVLAYAKHRTGREMGSRALVADSKETWVCSYLSVALLVGVGAYAILGWWWADPVGALAMLPVTLWQGWETLAEAREPDDHED